MLRKLERDAIRGQVRNRQGRPARHARRMVAHHAPPYRRSPVVADEMKPLEVASVGERDHIGREPTERIFAHVDRARSRAIAPLIGREAPIAHADQLEHQLRPLIRRLWKTMKQDDGLAAKTTRAASELEAIRPDVSNLNRHMDRSAALTQRSAFGR
jgi:hypothetical protein